MRRRPRRGLTAAVVLVGVLQTGAAQASEWRYCLALSPSQRTVYMSAPFPSGQALEAIEAGFGRALDRARIQHDSVQCPRGDAQSIAAMKLQAIQYSQANGDKVVRLNWKP